jgi:hypothetical protein
MEKHGIFGDRPEAEEHEETGNYYIKLKVIL